VRYWRSHKHSSTCFAADISRKLESLLPALEHLRTIDALSTEAISRQRCHALRVLSLDIDAVAFNIRVQEESEIIERLRTTKMHERPECDLRFVLGVYVSLVDSS